MAKGDGCATRGKTKGKIVGYAAGGAVKKGKYAMPKGEKMMKKGGSC